MKILIVNTSDIQGGAARAAYRLHKSLQSIGVDSQMLVQSKASDDYSVIGPVLQVDKGMGREWPIGPTAEQTLSWGKSLKSGLVFFHSGVGKIV